MSASETRSRSSESSSEESREGDPSDTKAMSVKSRRKQRRLERHGGVEGEKAYWKKKKQEKLERAKEKRKAKAAEQAREWEALTDEQREEIKVKTNAMRLIRAKEEEVHRAKCDANFAGDKTPVLVFDLSFEGVMNSAGVKSTAQQLKYSYSALKRAAFPFKPALYGFGEDSHILPILKNFEGFNKYPPLLSEEKFIDKLPKERIVYLSADSSTVLRTLNPDDIYVIGAFVDHNSQKGATQAAAEALGVRTARLPLDESINTQHICKVLTINHVVDVLITFSATHDWSKAFDSVLPKRRENAAARAPKVSAESCESSHRS